MMCVRSPVPLADSYMGRTELFYIGHSSVAYSDMIVIRDRGSTRSRHVRPPDQRPRGSVIQNASHRGGAVDY